LRKQEVELFIRPVTVFSTEPAKGGKGGKGVKGGVGALTARPIAQGRQQFCETDLEFAFGLHRLMQPTFPVMMSV
jgi:hypothetical protein